MFDLDSNPLCDKSPNLELLAVTRDPYNFIICRDGREYSVSRSEGEVFERGPVLNRFTVLDVNSKDLLFTTEIVSAAATLGTPVSSGVLRIHGKDDSAVTLKIPASQDASQFLFQLLTTLEFGGAIDATKWATSRCGNNRFLGEVDEVAANKLTVSREFYLNLSSPEIRDLLEALPSRASLYDGSQIQLSHSNDSQVEARIFNSRFQTLAVFTIEISNLLSSDIPLLPLEKTLDELACQAQVNMNSAFAWFKKLGSSSPPWNEEDVLSEETTPHENIVIGAEARFQAAQQLLAHLFDVSSSHTPGPGLGSSNLLAGNILQMVQKLGFNIKEVGQDEKFPRSLSQSEQFALDTLLETREFHIPLRDATLSLQFSSAGVRCDLWRATDDKSSNLGICMLSNNIAAERVTRFLNFYSKFPKADLKILWDRNIVGITVDMEVAG